MHTPNGLCLDCKFCLLDWMSNKKNPRKLRITTGVELGEVGQDGEGKCNCHICWLGNLWGAELSKARAAFKKEAHQEVGKGTPMRRCNHCFAATFQDTSSKHSCAGIKAVIHNLTEAIPQETRLKLALETLKEVQVAAGGDTFRIQSFKGGKATSVTLGSNSTSSTSTSLTLPEQLKVGTDAHLTGGQLRNVLANFRAKFGRSFAESGLDKQMALQNGRFLPFFTCERTRFEKEGTLVERPLFFCNSTLSFLKEVARLRGQDWEELTLLVQGDSGQGWFKLAVSLIPLSDLDENGREKSRRTRADGIACGATFKSYGVRQIQILALVQGVPESSVNLMIIFRYG